MLASASLTEPSPSSTNPLPPPPPSSLSAFARHQDKKKEGCSLSPKQGHEREGAGRLLRAVDASVHVITPCDQARGHVHLGLAVPFR
eukprot:244966-Rhodomonas_salina.1